MRISDWSSDVCSSDLHARRERVVGRGELVGRVDRRVEDVGQLVAVRGAEELIGVVGAGVVPHERSEKHTSELQSLMRISYAVFCLNKTRKRWDEHNA